MLSTAVIVVAGWVEARSTGDIVVVREISSNSSFCASGLSCSRIAWLPAILLLCLTPSVVRKLMLELGEVDRRLYSLKWCVLNQEWKSNGMGNIACNKVIMFILLCSTGSVRTPFNNCFANTSLFFNRLSISAKSYFTVDTSHYSSSYKSLCQYGCTDRHYRIAHT